MIGTALALLAMAPLPSDAVVERRVGAWDRSVELERAGDVEGARDVLVAGWGMRPDSYEVSVRIAHLTLELGERPLAKELYARAARLDGAGPEAERGLEASRSQSFVGELWLGGFDLTGADPSKVGGFAFVGARFHPSEQWPLRVAYRGVLSSAESSSTSRGFGGGRRSSSSTRTLTRHEAWLGAGYQGRHFRAEALGVGIFATGSRAVFGQAARVGAGHRYGAVVDQAALFPQGATNVQLGPALFAWPADALGLRAGARVTRVSGSTLGAFEGGVSLWTHAIEANVLVLQGRALAPVLVDIPLIADVDAEIETGVVASVLFPVSDSLALGASGEWYAAENGTDSVRYLSGALGLRYVARD